MEVTMRIKNEKVNQLFNNLKNLFLDLETVNEKISMSLDDDLPDLEDEKEAIILEIKELEKKQRKKLIELL
jgi:hypothetical protein